MTLNIENMYPSIKYGLVKKAINHFTSSFTLDEKATIEVCCHLIHFGMGSTFLCFKDQYYEYNGGALVDEKGLAIGGYESAFLADLVVLIQSKVHEIEINNYEWFLATWAPLCSSCHRFGSSMVR